MAPKTTTSMTLQSPSSCNIGFAGAKHSRPSAADAKVCARWDACKDDPLNKEAADASAEVGLDEEE